MCMSEKEIKDRIAAGELPATLSKEAWEYKLTIVKENNMRIYEDLLNCLINNGIPCECALCVIYFNNDDFCRKCPLYKMNECCNHDYSTYDKIWKCNSHDELIDGIANMIEVLDKAVQFEISEKNEN